MKLPRDMASLRQFVRQHIFDAGCLALIVVFVPLFVIKKPDIVYNSVSPEMRSGTKEVQQPVSPASQTEAMLPENGVSQEPYPSLAKRNIFDVRGEYPPESGKERGPLPENPYILTGILLSGEKYAVLKEYTGKIVVVKKGDMLIDGAEVEKIDTLSITVARGSKSMELKIFSPEEKKGK